MTETVGTDRTEGGRAAALVLAGIHLRLGSMGLARTELEILERSGALDAAGRVDLAEARWRTGDLTAAGDAARSALASGSQAVVALVIAAEAAAALGRPSEARRLSGEALALADGPIDPVFAGMPRSAVWPADPHEPAPAPATLFPTERTPIVPSSQAAAVASVEDEQSQAAAAAAERHAAALAAAPGLWEGLESEPEATQEFDAGTDAASGAAVDAVIESSGASGAPGAPDPAPVTDPLATEDAAALVAAGVEALRAGDTATAAVRLGLAVRLEPSSAADVLDAIGHTAEPGLQLVRGDALRALRRDDEARGAYRRAVGALVPPGSEGPPETQGPPRDASPSADEDGSLLDEDRPDWS